MNSVLSTLAPRAAPRVEMPDDGTQFVLPATDVRVCR